MKLICAVCLAVVQATGELTEEMWTADRLEDKYGQTLTFYEGTCYCGLHLPHVDEAVGHIRKIREGET